jgi:hypothetical protein
MVRRHDPARQRQPHPHSQIGAVVGQHVGGIGHPDAPRAADPQIDGVKADPVDRDHLDRRTGGQNIGPLAQIAARRDAANARADLCQKGGPVVGLEQAMQGEGLGEGALVPCGQRAHLQKVWL